MARLRDSHFKSKLGLLECSFLALAKGVAGVCIYLSFSCFVEYPIEWVNTSVNSGMKLKFLIHQLISLTRRIKFS